MSSKKAGAGGEIANAFPARLHVLLARAADTAVVFRRGPTSTYCTIGWDRATDRFQVGQWLRRRIYERRGDLSPDGQYLLYFARSGRQLKAGGSYTALARAPWLKAIGLWVQDNSYFGGGLFRDNCSLYLRSGEAGAAAKKLPKELKILAGFPYPGWGRYVECLGIYFPRLIRDGWKWPGPEAGLIDSETLLFERALPGGWRLQKLAHMSIAHKPGAGVYYDEHRLQPPGGVAALDRLDWDWADWDAPRERLVWTERGRLYAAAWSAAGPGVLRLLQDFNSMRYESREAPY